MAAWMRELPIVMGIAHSEETSGIGFPLLCLGILGLGFWVLKALYKRRVFRPKDDGQG